MLWPLVPPSHALLATLALPLATALIAREAARAGLPQPPPFISTTHVATSTASSSPSASALQFSQLTQTHSGASPFDANTTALTQQHPQQQHQLAAPEERRLQETQPRTLRALPLAAALVRCVLGFNAQPVFTRAGPRAARRVLAVTAAALPTAAAASVASGAGGTAAGAAANAGAAAESDDLRWRSAVALVDVHPLTRMHRAARPRSLALTRARIRSCAHAHARTHMSHDGTDGSTKLGAQVGSVVAPARALRLLLLPPPLAQSLTDSGGGGAAASASGGFVDVPLFFPALQCSRSQSPSSSRSRSALLESRPLRRALARALAAAARSLGLSPRAQRRLLVSQSHTISSGGSDAAALQRPPLLHAAVFVTAAPCAETGARAFLRLTAPALAASRLPPRALLAQLLPRALPLPPLARAAAKSHTPARARAAARRRPVSPAFTIAAAAAGSGGSSAFASPGAQCAEQPRRPQPGPPLPPPPPQFAVRGRRATAAEAVQMSAAERAAMLEQARAELYNLPFDDDGDAYGTPAKAKPVAAAAAAKPKAAAAPARSPAPARWRQGQSATANAAANVHAHALTVTAAEPAATATPATAHAATAHAATAHAATSAANSSHSGVYASPRRAAPLVPLLTEATESAAVPNDSSGIKSSAATEEARVESVNRDTEPATGRSDALSLDANPENAKSALSSCAVAGVRSNDGSVCSSAVVHDDDISTKYDGVSETRDARTTSGPHEESAVSPAIASTVTATSPVSSIIYSKTQSPTNMRTRRSSMRSPQQASDPKARNNAAAPPTPEQLERLEEERQQRLRQSLGLPQSVQLHHMAQVAQRQQQQQEQEQKHHHQQQQLILQQQQQQVQQETLYQHHQHQSQTILSQHAHQNQREKHGHVLPQHQQQINHSYNQSQKWATAAPVQVPARPSTTTGRSAAALMLAAVAASSTSSSALPLSASASSLAHVSATATATAARHGAHGATRPMLSPFAARAQQLQAQAAMRSQPMSQ